MNISSKVESFTAADAEEVLKNPAPSELVRLSSAND
jgi:hypothetical protein